MPTAGHILLDKAFVFNDKNVGKKLVIALNTCNNKETCLVLKTTSQSIRYTYTTPGCNSCKGIFCIFEECEQGFPEDTYVQLDYVYPINVEQLLNKKQIAFVDRLSDICFTNLKKCLRNFKKDIPTGFWSLIYPIAPDYSNTY